MKKHPRPRPAQPVNPFWQEARQVSRPLLLASLLLSFFFALALYLLTLAPTVTFEDSGELITAAYHLGVPHEPGYPLFTLLAHLFTFFPVGSVAWRVNLFSAVCSAAAVALLTWTVVLVIEEVAAGKAGALRQPVSGRPAATGAQIPISAQSAVLIKYLTALAAGLLMASGLELWEQSIITEVYGLHMLLVAAILFFTLLWLRSAAGERLRCFLLICFLLGLSLSNHTTALMLIPPLAGFVLLVDRPFLLNLRRIASGLAALLAGLLPYLYLPLASARNPWMDWGDPENLTNFLRVISRHQYGTGISQNLSRFTAELQVLSEQTLQQWFPAVLLLTLAGLLILSRRHRPLFYFSLLFLIFSGPVVTFLTDFDVTVRDSFVAGEHRALVSVFYIPFYGYLALLMGVGFFAAAAGASKFPVLRAPRLAGAAGLVLAALLLPALFSNYRQLNMRHYSFARDYAHNLFSVAKPDAVVFANWDPFYFPLNYAQFVEGERPDVIAVDQQLLRRSWYVHWLTRHYPDWISAALPETEAFLQAVQPFEEGRPFNGDFIQSRYIAMINALIDRSLELGRPVYFTYTPPPEISRRYFLEPQGVAIRLQPAFRGPEEIDVSALRLQRFYDQSVPLDRMARYFRSYYAGLLFGRGALLQKFAQNEAAKENYRLAAKLAVNQPQLAGQIDTNLQQLDAAETD